MKEINFDRGFAYRYELSKLVIRVTGLLIGAFFVDSFILTAKLIDLLSFQPIHYVFNIPWYFLVLIAIYAFFEAIRLKIIINTTQYSIEEHKLIKQWSFITKTVDIARLQVINSIVLNQSLLQRMFGIFNLTVDYGFGANGYEFTYQYLDEKTCLEIEEYLKSQVQGIQGVKIT